MKLSQKLSQRQIISPRLQLSLRLLTLNNVALEEAIAAELENNPVLERESGSEESNEAPTPVTHETSETFNWREYFESNPWVGGADEEGNADTVSTLAEPPDNLTVHLLKQLEAYREEADYELAANIVYALDDDGYLRTPTADLARELGVDETRLVTVLTRIIQKLDPPGVGARDLRECLLIQWRLAGGGAPPLAGVIIEKYLDEIPRKSNVELAALLNSRPEEVEEALAFIRALEPRPGRPFGSTTALAIVPDLRVELGDEGVEVTLLNDPAARLYISPYYRDLIDGEVDAETRRFVRGRIAAATWFIRALHQRRRTLEEVTREVFKKQKAFLEEGEIAIQPLTMEEVASALGVHVSTVSRAVAGKVVETPMGLFPLRRFFTVAVKGDAGDVSPERVKSLLAEIIAEEDKDHPLSDAALAAALARRGVYVARRTVSKYRQELGIGARYERARRV